MMMRRQTQLLLFLLLFTCAASQPYVRKCCKADMALHNFECKKVNETLRSTYKFEVPKFVNASGIVGVYETNKFQIIYEKLNCGGYILMEPLKEKDYIFSVTEMGELYANEEYISPDKYCLEQLVENNFTSMAVVCERTEITTNSTTETTSSTTIFGLQSKSIIDIGMIISLPFLFLTFLTYALIKKLRSNVHVKFQMCHVASLSLAYMSYIANSYLISKIHQKNINCLILAYTQQYFFIATFFWLNAMCFNIWWTLCELRPISKNKQKEAKKFIKYSVYAWGCPLLISIFTYLIDEIFSPSNFIRPEFGYSKCWFDKDNISAKWIYFYGPVAILLFSDLLMFILTLKILFELEKNGKKYLNGTESSGFRKNQKQNFILYSKLFIIMGGNWLAEITPEEAHGGGILWNLVDIFNALQGVFIFIIFVCQDRVLKLLGQKFYSRFKTRKIIKNTYHKTNSSVLNEKSLQIIVVKNQN